MTALRSAFGRAALCALAILLPAPARAAAMQMVESRPAAQAVMDGRDTEFFVRFDGPVDHARSRLTVVQDGRVVQTLHPRLQSQPNVLFSGVRRLPPGGYTLHWTVQAARDHDVSEGDVAFSVR